MPIVVADVALSEVDVFAFNIALSDTSATSQIDNTPVDGDPDVLVASLRAAFGEGPDMNPAHIIRECLTNRDWGLGHGFTDIGPSFATAADALFAEGFGLSLLWQQESTIEDFIADVLKHIDAYLYVDRRSGRWELKLIRADYDAKASISRTRSLSACFSTSSSSVILSSSSPLQVSGLATRTFSEDRR